MASSDEDSRRHSQFDGPEPQLELDAKARARREVENGFAQIERQEALIAEGIPSFFKLKPSILMDLNRLAVDGLVRAPGSYRQGPITIGKSRHQPPDWKDVPRLVDEMCDYVNEHWDNSAVHLSAYVLWRLNWIHPFADGNGRTARAAAYIVLCVRLRKVLPGTNTVPERIKNDLGPYYAALEEADDAWARGQLHVGKMEQMLKALLIDQVSDAATDDRRYSRPRRNSTSREATAMEPRANSADKPWWKHPTVIAAAVAALIKSCFG